MAVALAACPPDADPPDDRWDFEPSANEDFRYDPADDRKWEAFLLDEDERDPSIEEFHPL